jgi:hypothetical protein
VICKAVRQRAKIRDRTLQRLLASILRRGGNYLATSHRRPDYKPGEREELLNHLAYEWLMFDHMRATWRVCRQRHVLEALLLHSRNLRDFLFGRIEQYGRHADKAVLAADYVDRWSADKGDHRYKVLWDTDQAINAQLAHLSRRRVDPPAQRPLDREAEMIAEALATAWDSFRDALTGTHWSKALDSAIEEKRTELRIP